MGKIAIHGIIGSPPTRAVLIVARTIGVPHELKHLEANVKTPEFKQFNPQQLIPVMVENDFVLPESRAIMQYLMDKYANDDSLYPKDLKARALINARLNFDCGTLWPRTNAAMKPTFFGGKPPEEAVQALREAYQIVDEFLTRNTWVAGSNLTIADISFNTILSTLAAFGFDFTQYPKIHKWLEGCRQNIPNYRLNEEGIESLKERIAQLRKAAAKK